MSAATPNITDSCELSERFRQVALDTGFDFCGFAPAVAPPTYPNFLDWLAAGHHAGMEYLDRRLEAYRHPEGVLNGVRSIAVLAINYSPHQCDHPIAKLSATGDQQVRTAVEPSARANLAKYATIAADYHESIRRKLRTLCEWLQTERPGSENRGVVDTAPLLERDFARQAGLGWFGKNTLMINKRLGSWLLLAAVLTDIDFPPDGSFDTSHCGSCTRCLDACPTQAFPKPYTLDSRRCIAYWTIEHRGVIPVEIRPAIGEWLFGCDICQDVCPWNRKSPPATDSLMQPRDDLTTLAPADLLLMDEPTFRARFHGTPLMRSRRTGMARNAAIVLGNQADRASVPVLAATLGHNDPIVRETVVWALGEIVCEESRIALIAAAATESDPEVRSAISHALARLTPQANSVDADSASP